MKEYQEIPLKFLLNRRKDSIILQNNTIYKRVTIKLNSRGIKARDELDGENIGTKKQFMIQSGQFLLSKIDARNGAFGIVPEECHGAVITGNFWTFDVNHTRLDSRYFEYLTRTPAFLDFCIRASEGTTNRRYLQETKFLQQRIPLPPLAEQQRIVGRIEALAGRIEEIGSMRREMERDLDRTLQIAYQEIVSEAKRALMSEVAPIVRRPLETKADAIYHELGIRSFGKGTFHKQPVTGLELGDKRVFHIEPGDLLFSNVFAWEGAIAVARPEDVGRIGSHRFISCVPRQGVATAHFLCYHFLTTNGLLEIGEASPGGAGRNRTLGLSKLEKIGVPVPPLQKQLWFNSLQAKVEAVKRLQAETQAELAALLPAVLARAFRGEL